MTITTDLPTPQRALAIGAHPDDIEFDAGATLAKWATGGCEVSLVICTDGSKGTWDPNADTARLAVTRQDEQRAAAAELGATGEVIFLGWTDGELDSGLRQRAQVASCIRRLRPDVVLGHDPWRAYRLHPDHRHAGLLAVEGVVAARDPHFFPEIGMEHHRPDELLLFEAGEVDHVERVDGFQTHKLAALEAHGSQFESTMFVTGGNSDELAAFRERELASMRSDGALVDAPYGEAFKRISEL
ncbi:MAG: PIG-L deacetylase family protein [Acidimicrobiales bacterium]